MLIMNYKLFIITVLSFILPLFIGTLINNKIVALTKIISDKNAKILTSIKDLLSGFGVIKSFNAEKEVSKTFSKDFYDLEKENGKLKQYDIFSLVFCLLFRYLVLYTRYILKFF